MDRPRRKVLRKIRSRPSQATTLVKAGRLWVCAMLARRRLPEGLAGITMLHELVAEHLDPAAEADQVLVGAETERGPWVQALLAAGYVVFAINPLQVARYRERHSPSRAKSDAGRAADPGRGSVPR